LDVDHEDPVGSGSGDDNDEGSDSGSDDESVVIAAYEDRRPDYSMQVQIVAVEREISNNVSDYESDEEENEEIYDP
jgi:hypothetical protein